MENNKEAVKLAAEIKRKAINATVENLDILSKGHFSALHIGLSDTELKRRRKSEASTFYDNETVNYALAKIFEDDITVLKVAEWVISGKEPRMELCTSYLFENPLGKVKYACGEIVDAYFPIFVIQKLDSKWDRNRVTGMPFEFVTAYIEE